MKNMIFGIKLFATLLLCAATAVASHAQTPAAAPTVTFTRLHNFNGADGAESVAGLVQGTDGGLYGVTSQGGANGFGSVFSITLEGTLTTLHSFDSTDGAYPSAGLVQGTDGNFYGTTMSGGANNFGTVFSITTGGTLTTLHSFDYTDGAYPAAVLNQAADGKFYGTTSEGGANSDCIGTNGCGTVFSITAGGTLTTLHIFGGTDGAEPTTGLIQGWNGHFYGTTRSGGASTNCSGGCGTIFEITENGTLRTLHSFAGYPTDGEDPMAGLVQGTDGNFYGTTYVGGSTTGDGTVFKISAGGTLTVLHSFNYLDGAYPLAGLIQGTDGNFYGTTEFGGNSGPGVGTAFSITPGGALTTILSFKTPFGALPVAGLAQDTNGTFYGTTSTGGMNRDGTIFALSIGLGPFVQPSPPVGTVGMPVKILGNNLTGTTSVTFNGTPATFTVVSPSLITTTVPAGATSGKVQVSNGSGNLSSNVVFRVRP